MPTPIHFPNKILQLVKKANEASSGKLEFLLSISEENNSTNRYNLMIRRKGVPKKVTYSFSSFEELHSFLEKDLLGSATP